ncbi:hypothetical protein H0H92_007648 [Tricholoma furcatifolium]|nr:hypothetical protein H0H92_007648 [Tricholoma furcatifolium]
MLKLGQLHFALKDTILEHIQPAFHHIRPYICALWSVLYPHDLSVETRISLEQLDGDSYERVAGNRFPEPVECCDQFIFILLKALRSLPDVDDAFPLFIQDLNDEDLPANTHDPLTPKSRIEKQDAKKQSRLAGLKQPDRGPDSPTKPRAAKQDVKKQSRGVTTLKQLDQLDEQLVRESDSPTKKRKLN